MGLLSARFSLSRDFFFVALGEEASMIAAIYPHVTPRKERERLAE